MRFEREGGRRHRTYGVDATEGPAIWVHEYVKGSLLASVALPCKVTVSAHCHSSPNA